LSAAGNRKATWSGACGACARGSAGCAAAHARPAGHVLYSKNKTVHVKAEAREVFDVSGAGDTVIARSHHARVGAAAGAGDAHRQPRRRIKVAKLGTAVVTRKELFG